ncbi:hypothetical protein [Rhodovulum adriaticum]|uniref:Uncharacterized protein n=1 Tax=Rhodovulum adriaticum TaxID=35804 RepID=A0A4R2NIY1_RHOAD|nr:hypothetical protein [Rhodovulum adriaticum]MBK1635856.1 hypothetical protein [Rhodovulum adriaticum]TCP21397.1 hypothetical protein EV656_11148 [Rhodovulum adriaticum]
MREYDGQDLVYYTHLASYRCALAEVRIGINTDTAAVLLPMEPCYRDETPPNAVRETPYIAFPLGSVSRVAVAITYADGETDAALFGRAGLIRP